MTADPELANLARTAWQQYRDVEGESWRVTPGAPVLYFGDLPKFEASDVRIVTVGLNPSNQEFPVGAPFCRFTGVDTDDATQYLSALNAYFRQCPYTAWFDFYEQALLGAGASYYGESKNVALHTDIASVIPTDPTWSRLGSSTQNRLAKTGIKLWHQLIERLQPDFVIQSTAKQWLRRIEFDHLTEWTTIHSFTKTQDGKCRKRHIDVQTRWHSLDSGKRFLLAHIPAAQKPLAALSHDQKRHAGEVVLGEWERSG